jgi:hypothetical protein
MTLHKLETGSGGGVAGALREVARAIDAGKIPFPVEAVLVIQDEHGRALTYGLGGDPDPIRATGLLALGKLALMLEYFEGLTSGPKAS